MIDVYYSWSHFFLGTGCAILKGFCYVLQEWGLYGLGLGSGLGLL